MLKMKRFREKERAPLSPARRSRSWHLSIYVSMSIFLSGEPPGSGSRVNPGEPGEPEANLG